MTDRALARPACGNCGTREARVVNLQRACNARISGGYRAGFGRDSGQPDAEIHRMAPRQTVIYQSGDASIHSSAGGLQRDDRGLAAEGFLDRSGSQRGVQAESVYVDAGWSGGTEPAGVGGDQRAAVAIECADFQFPGRVAGFVLAACSSLWARCFLLIEIAALITGIVLTRGITSAIAELYQATQYVQAGDLTHRVKIERRDQLGILGESFNLMTGSISGLIEEQKQAAAAGKRNFHRAGSAESAFPSALPSVPGVEIEAICKAARTVSGDYYDFIQLSRRTNCHCDRGYFRQGNFGGVVDGQFAGGASQPVAGAGQRR